MSHCPRCTHPGPLTSRSRTTLARTIAICSPCGQAEAARDATGRAPIPPADWPIRPLPASPGA